MDGKSRTDSGLIRIWVTLSFSWTPGKNWLQVCDAEALHDIFHRRGDFIRPVEMLGMPVMMSFNALGGC